ncbi:MAG: iron-containing alcohol dehydrogenase [Anaerolineaceae bacterium]|nr:iron-containing alcohol dehydrogenase [Anaerolineaceae bacterium]
MNTQFDFSSASRIVFGQGKLTQVGSAAAGMGKKALVVAGFHNQDFKRLTALLEDNRVAWEAYQVNSEPDIDTVEKGRMAAQETGCDLVIGFGGGSAIDTGKAIAALMTNPGEILDYLEVVGRNLPMQALSLPYIAIPTTAGTGSEVTRNAVISVPEKRVKVSLRSPLMLPSLAIVDPQLTLSLPPAVTASTGMDALAQVIEPFVSKRANPMVDMFCREGIQRAARSLLTAFQSGMDQAAREDMAFTSLMGGLSLANAGLGAVHGFAGPLGGMFSAPHGAVCACLLSPVVQVNARALAQREPDHPAYARYLEISRLVTGKNTASIEDLICWLEDLRVSLAIPSLRTFGLKQEDLVLLVEKGAAASSMKTNPIVLQNEELHEVLELAM